MADFLQGLPLFSVTLTIGAYMIGLWCQKKWKSPIANPILIGVVLVAAVLLTTGYPIAVYAANSEYLTWLLTPATICLALPLYEQLKVLKKNLPAILGGIFAGTVTSLMVVFGLCKLFALDRVLTVSLLPKSISSAVGYVLSGDNGGLASLTSAVIIITGIFASITGSSLCRLFRLQDPVSQGVAMGTAGHVIATARATEMGALQGAVGSLSLTVAAILTAFLFPFMCMLL